MNPKTTRIPQEERRGEGGERVNQKSENLHKEFRISKTHTKDTPLEEGEVNRNK